MQPFKDSMVPLGASLYMYNEISRNRLIFSNRSKGDFDLLFMSASSDLLCIPVVVVVMPSYYSGSFRCGTVVKCPCSVDVAR